jgi:hypothetical protein
VYKRGDLLDESLELQCGRLRIHSEEALKPVGEADRMQG